MNKINSRKEIEKRNNSFFKEVLNISLDEFFVKMIRAGKPRGFADGVWSEKNPTAGRCGSIVGALRISNKIPKGYIPCGQKEENGGSHFYLINPKTKEVIDPTVYQMNKEYNYKDYHTRFLPQLSRNVTEMLKEFNLEIDNDTFQIKKDKRGVTLVCKKSQK